jgi:hypothetical protein
MANVPSRSARDPQHQTWDRGIDDVELFTRGTDSRRLSGSEVDVVQWHVVTFREPICGPVVDPLPCDTPPRTATLRDTQGLFTRSVHY